jgi:hypothetical protein
VTATVKLTVFTQLGEIDVKDSQNYKSPTAVKVAKATEIDESSTTNVSQRLQEHEWPTAVHKRHLSG